MSIDTLKEMQTKCLAMKQAVDEIVAHHGSEHNRSALCALEKTLQEPDSWHNIDKMKQLNREKSQLANKINLADSISHDYNYLCEFIALSLSESDTETVANIQEDFGMLSSKLAQLEIEYLFSHPLDTSCAFITIKPGAGGTESQDWAAMLMRMYIRWAESHSFTASITDYHAGEEAGIKNVTIFIEGDSAFGWARTEHGVHRLVRRSPFDSNNRRHTSFASVSVMPEIDETVQVTINPSDLRIDVYRASGAGGQHVNRTESAVRITHLPSGFVTQCQSGRSQHKNKATALKQLQSLLYNQAREEKKVEMASHAEEKTDIEWGYQIRSYVLDQSRIKDIRTGVEIGNTQSVLDGNLDPFILAQLKALAQESQTSQSQTSQSKT